MCPFRMNKNQIGDKEINIWSLMSDLMSNFYSVFKSSYLSLLFARTLILPIMYVLIFEAA